ncbi:sensor histidine kinase [Neobacillus sp. LXY-4]|uniref:sensor histidine kinase n=1 Tax=Neobacillus sp. LXY-4 TaxID=3379826 RepID=UPI003EE340AC
MKTISSNNISSYIIRSQEEEIKRVAMELHEGVGQTLYSIYTGLQFIETGVSEPQTKQYVKEMAELLEKTIQEIRLFSVELYPPALTTFGLLAAIKNYTQLYTSTFGIEVEVESIGSEVSIAEEKNITIFRVCQEAFANIAKYADTSKAKITFTWTTNQLAIMITDFGKGFNLYDNENSASGLAAMKERMGLAGGDCTITSSIGEGTTVHILLPI